MTMKPKKKDFLVADFETTSYNFYEKNGYTKVWLYAVSNSEAEITNYGENIDSFFNYIKKEAKGMTIYFHNLKFDGQFILNYLLSNGYAYKDKLTYKSNRGFSTLISEEGAFYQIKINFARGKQVTIQDSLKIIPLKVEAIAKAFELPIQKLKLDYDNYEVTPTALEYVFNDVKIVAMGLKTFKDLGYDKMTIGACSYNSFMDSCSMKKDLFPVLDRDWCLKWRKAYRGGRSQVNPKYENKVLTNVNRYDINSMYPYAQGYFYMPYGKPMKINQRGKYRFELYEVKIWFKLKKGHLPTLLRKGSMYGRTDSYYTETELVETILISNIDLELVERHYDIYYLEFVEMWGFKTSRFIFRRFIDQLYELKNNSSGALKLVYKLLINNLYGKFGSKPKGKIKHPVYNEELQKVEYVNGEDEDMRIYYLPVAIAITSVCHKLIDDAILATGYKNFVYCDTDSVHTLGTLPADWIDNKRIGAFKFEGVEVKAKYVRQKCYITEEYNDKKQKYEVNITCCGMPDSVKKFLIRTHKEDVFEVFKVGLKVGLQTEGVTLEDLKLQPKAVQGGVVLAPTQFSLN